MTAAADHVRALQKKGFLAVDRGKARSIRLIGKGKGRDVSGGRDHGETGSMVPVFGVIPAGYADDRRQVLDGTLEIPPVMFGKRSAETLFALTVQGDSMIGRQIVEGDCVILDSAREPEDGCVVAALIDGESTLKTFVRDANGVRLKAENPAYPGLIPGDELVIQGVMIGLVRRGSM